MVRPSLLPSFAIVVGLSVGLAGCGDDKAEPSDTTATAALSSSALRSKADAICGRVKKDSEALPAPSDLADLEKLGPKLLAISEKGVRDLEALEPPSSDAATMTKLIGILKASNKELEGVAKAAEAGDDDGATAALDASTAKLTEFAATAKEAGFSTCGQGVESSAETDTTETTAASDTTAATDAGFADVDLGEKLNPIDGFTYQTLPDDARSALVDALGSSPDVKALVAAVGTTAVTDDNGTSLLIFLGLNRELSGDEAQQLVDSVTAGGTNVEQGDVAGTTGWAYVSSDGQQGFVTVRTDTVVVGLSDSTDHLAAVIQGLFVANPDL